MSLDIELYDIHEIEHECYECGHKRMIKPLVFEANITHNLGVMAKEAGLYYAMWRPEELNINVAKNLISYLDYGVKLLKFKVNYFKEFNPENGWGTYEGLLEVATDYLEACIKYPEAEIKVSR